MTVILCEYDSTRKGWHSDVSINKGGNAMTRPLQGRVFFVFEREKENEL